MRVKEVSPILPCYAVAGLPETQQNSILLHPRDGHFNIFHVIEKLATLYIDAPANILIVRS